MRKDEVSVLWKLGTCHAALGDTESARECWAAADRTLESIGLPQVREVSRTELRRLIGEVGEVSDA